VPPSMIADLERATFSNSEQQARTFVDYTLMPYLTRIEARIRLRLLAEKDQANHFAKFNVNALLRGDMKSRGEFYTRQVQNGALSPNEIRELEDQNPREGGDIYLTPANMLIDGKPPPEAEPAKEGTTP
jgi:HK97 family phage portal protein